MSNPLEPTSPALGGLRSPSPEMISPAERLEEAACLLARGIPRRGCGWRAGSGLFCAWEGGAGQNR